MANIDRNGMEDAINAFMPINLDSLSDDDMANLLQCLQGLSIARQSEAGPGVPTARKFSERGGSGWAARRMTLLNKTPHGKAAASRKR
jgi:hypothetical protein